MYIFYDKLNLCNSPKLIEFVYKKGKIAEKNASTFDIFTNNTVSLVQFNGLYIFPLTSFDIKLYELHLH